MAEENETQDEGQEKEAGEKHEPSREELLKRVKIAEREAIERKEKLRDSRSELETLMEKLKEREDKEKSDTQKLTEQLAEAERKRVDAEGQVTTTAIKAKMLVELVKAGAKDPSDAYLLADLSNVSYEDGEVSGVEESVKQLGEAKEYLFGKETKPKAPPEPGAGAKKKSGGGEEESPGSVLLKALKSKQKGG